MKLFVRLQGYLLLIPHTPPNDMTVSILSNSHATSITHRRGYPDFDVFYHMT